MSHWYWANPLPYSGTWTRTREPGPVVGNLDLNRFLVWDLYSGTWTRTWEPVLVYVLKNWLNIGDSYGTSNRSKYQDMFVSVWWYIWLTLLEQMDQKLGLDFFETWAWNHHCKKFWISLIASLILCLPSDFCL